MASGKKKVVRRIKADTKDAPASAHRADGSTEAKAAANESVAAKPSTEKPATVKRVVKKVVRKAPAQPAAKTAKAKSGHKPFIIFRPFVALGHYIRDSWHELRHVEWPNRRATWKMTLGVIIFCLIIGLIVLLSDWASQWLIQEVIL